MRKLALLVLMSAAAQGAIIQINPNEIDITLSSALDSNGDGSSSAATTIYLLGTHLSVEVNPGTQLPALFGCAVGPAFCLSDDQVGVNIAGVGSVFTFVQILNTGEADASGSAGGNFPGVTPGVYDLTAEADPLYRSNTGVIPSGTIVNTIVIEADGPGVSLSPYRFPIPEPGTWMLAGIGVVAFAARKFYSSCSKSRCSKSFTFPALLCLRPASSAREQTPSVH
jgi:hypothetical protein